MASLFYGITGIKCKNSPALASPRAGEFLIKQDNCNNKYGLTLQKGRAILRVLTIYQATRASQLYKAIYSDKPTLDEFHKVKLLN